MIRSTENQEKKFYLGSSGGWEVCVLAKDSVDAAAIGLEKAFEEYGDSLVLSNCITSTNCSDIKHQEPDELEVDLFYVPSVLSDIGKNGLAAELDSLLKNMQKKLDKQKTI